MGYSVNDLLDLVSSSTEQMKATVDIYKNSIAKMGLHFEVVDELMNFNKETIHNFDDSIYVNIWNKFSNGEVQPSEDLDKFHQEIKDTICEVGDIALDTLKDLYDQYNEIINDTKKALDDYSEYISSPEFKKKENEAMDNLKKKLDETTDESDKKKLQKRIDAINNAESLSFMLDRVNSIGQKEVDRITDLFFDSREYKSILDRFINKTRKMGFKDGWYKKMVDLEITFLPDKYHPFNNLFMFHIIRTVIHCDIDNPVDSMYARSIISRVLRLIYNKYSDKDERDGVINLIMEFEDKFMDKKELFDNRNTSYTIDNTSSIISDNDFIQSIKDVMLEKFNLTGLDEMYSTANSDKSYREWLQDKYLEYRELYDLRDFFKRYKISTDKELESYNLDELKEVKDNYLKSLNKTPETDESSEVSENSDNSNDTLDMITVEDINENEDTNNLPEDDKEVNEVSE
jgi:hypothetical protein